MNDFFLRLGIEHLKPVATALLLPPLPFFFLALVGLLVTRRRHRLGTGLVIGGVVTIWLSACLGVAHGLAPLLLPLPPALTEAQVAEMKLHARDPVALVVLGGGLEAWAPEYGASSLHFRSLERLRYGLWLGRRTGWPVGFSGGLGWGQAPNFVAATEATVAQRIAGEEFGRALRWVESRSRDTRENAINTVAMLRSQGIKRVVLVTHQWHMPRAVRNFERAVGTDPIRIEAAPIGLASDDEVAWMRWIPTGEGLSQVRQVLREWLGMVTGA